ncbi:MAG TPA: hypothetical protein VFJ90_00240, partial [Candidatus Didemnitutus sp.]|nr:hypothetical protein [Candidatus Didemnitutus sp.]
EKQTEPNADHLLFIRRSASLVPGFLRPTALIDDWEYAAPELRNASQPPATINPDGSLHFSDDFLRLIAPYLGNARPELVLVDPLNTTSKREFQLGSAELQQIWQTDRQTLLLGARVQSGEFRVRDLLTVANAGEISTYQSPAAAQKFSVPYSRESVYAYEFFRATPALTLIAGASYDHVEHPANVLSPPFSDKQMEVSRTNAKLGFTYAPGRWFTVRGAYLEAVGGATYDESVRLEPVQIAGFSQAFRSVISESLVGTVQAPVYETLGASVEGSTPGRTWWGASYNRIDESVERTVGTFDFFFWAIAPEAKFPTNTPQKMDYREEVYTATLDQLFGDQFAAAITYRRTEADLHRVLPLAAAVLNDEVDRTDHATLDEVLLHAVWNSPLGWFAWTQAAWRKQEVTTLPVNLTTHDDFWQVDVAAGRRFRQNKCEISAGVLNLTDQDYQLNPLTYTQNIPHERTFFVRCRVGF